MKKVKLVNKKIFKNKSTNLWTVQITVKDKFNFRTTFLKSEIKTKKEAKKSLENELLKIVFF